MCYTSCEQGLKEKMTKEYFIFLNDCFKNGLKSINWILVPAPQQYWIKSLT